jgi:hypothetical protein
MSISSRLEITPRRAPNPLIIGVVEYEVWEVHPRIV